MEKRRRRKNRNDLFLKEVTIENQVGRIKLYFFENYVKSCPKTSRFKIVKNETDPNFCSDTMFLKLPDKRKKKHPNSHWNIPENWFKIIPVEGNEI